VLLVYLLTNHDQIAATVVLMNHKPFQGGRAPLASTFREFPKRGSSPHVHDHDSRSRRWGEYWLELLGDSGFVPEDRLAAVKKETGELKGIFVSIVVNTKAKSRISKS
jgi:hypothetical protein